MSEQEAVFDQYLESDRLTHAGWKRALIDGILLGQKCLNCGHQTAAPKAACAHCGERELKTVELPASGEVFTETTVAVPPEQFDGPHQVAVIDLGECRVMAGIEGDVAIGDEVELTGVLTRDDEPGPLFG